MEQNIKSFKEFIPDNALFELKLPIEFDLEDVHCNSENKTIFTFKNEVNGLIVNLSFRHNLKNITSKDKITTNKLKYMFRNDSVFGLSEKKILHYNFLITFNYFPNNDNIIFSKIFYELETIVDSIKLINRGVRSSQFFFYKFGNFMESLLASNILLENAIKNSCYLETTIILINHIDALLRTSIILKKQLLNVFDEKEDLSLIYQQVDKKPILEREIYKKAKELQIIDGLLFQKLNDNYKYRNNIIHKFLITNINIAGIIKYIYELIELKSIVFDIVYNLETEQIETKIGMTKNYEEIIEVFGNNKVEVLEMIVNNIAIKSKLNNIYKST